jgi:hypothetical protein
MGALITWCRVMVKVRKALFALGCAAAVGLAIIQYCEMFSDEPTLASVIAIAR